MRRALGDLLLYVCLRLTPYNQSARTAVQVKATRAALRVYQVFDVQYEYLVGLYSTNLQGSLSIRPFVRGAFFFFRKFYGPVRCSLNKLEILPVRFGAVLRYIVNPTVRFGAVIFPTMRFGPVLKNRNMGILRWGLVRF